ncbi:beclin 1-associated autophagy-related key regulator [Patella vulgata]|uniref:beclin 1-associated autophagy-related key regulator n=1 Tax=Patella vulgata TaxID=6465 RepID=UPI0021803E0A|nr:beclin 1-associated autophagy-related key regulator [Patella vulgata]
MAFNIESNGAPVNFYTQYSGEESPGVTVAVERCPLCKCSVRPYYCHICVTDGCFQHSINDKRLTKDAYHQKQQKWKKEKEKRIKLLNKVETAIVAKEKKYEKLNEIEECKRRILLLKNAIKTVNKETDKAENRLIKSRERTSQRRSKGRLHDDKVQKIKKYIISGGLISENKRDETDKTMDILQNGRQSHVQALTNYIFPITETRPSHVETSMINTIKEACQTAYVRGKWQYTDLRSDTLYKILEPTLPSNGNFSAYNLWVSVTRENGAAPDSECGTSNPGHTFRAALCYATQLLSILLHILDINSPRKLCYSEFCSDELTEKQLNSAVNKLNHNILYVCFSQGISIEDVSPKDTLHNLYILLHNSNIGRCIPFEVCEEMIQSVTDGSVSDDSEDEPDTLTDDVDIGLDWELPSDFPDVTTRGSSSTSTYTTNCYTQAGVNEGGGLLASATTSIASLWQAARSTLERR